MKTLDIAMIAVSAALYAIVGIMTSMGIIDPVFGLVKFWPAVVVPGIFAVLFGRWVGGIGAAIGIFISDVLAGHGNALLSFTIGCTSNFVCFYLVGLLSRRNMKWRDILILLTVGSVALTGMTGYLYSINQLTLDIVKMFLGVLYASVAIVIGFGLWKPEWKNYGLASVVGLLMGSAIIGFGIWAYSYVLPLPPSVGLERNAPLYASFVFLVWTFATEIPFLVAIVPPVVKVCYRALPFLEPPNTE